LLQSFHLPSSQFGYAGQRNEACAELIEPPTPPARTASG
jgi:hypothetical protein